MLFLLQEYQHLYLEYDVVNCWQSTIGTSKYSRNYFYSNIRQEQIRTISSSNVVCLANIHSTSSTIFI